jgi:multicomponent Na+:H+ antiporter subunit C
MSSSLTLMIVSGVLITAGVYLMMERSVTRILVGVLLAGNGVNLLFLIASGEPKGAPFIGTERGRDISDPLPQAMVLTAIVITLGLTAFLLTMAYRSFQLNGHDEVADDVEDRQIVQLAEADLASASFDEDDRSLPSEDDSDPDPAEEGSEEQRQEGADSVEQRRPGADSVEQRRRGAEADERRDPAEEATDEIIGRGEGGTGS